eukprot:6459593-Amphidinium_carterae.2
MSVDVAEVQFATQIPQVRALDAQIFTVLLALTKGEASDIAMNASGRSGLDDWRRLSRRFDASSSGRKRALLKNVLEPGSFDNQQLRQAIEQHERLVRDFERRRPGSEGVPKQVDEEIRISILRR